MKNDYLIFQSYRLAPESPFPTPITDCYEACSYLINNLKEFDLDFVDTNKIILAGDSAGK
jgi:acetyl esterase/lipase